MLSQTAHSRFETPREYIDKIRRFSDDHEEYRARSPSYKRMSHKTKDAIIKIKEIYTEKEKKKEVAQSQYEEISSPLIRKHEKLFSRLF